MYNKFDNWLVNKGMQTETLKEFYDNLANEGYATCTTAESHYYADGTSGNDLNDGLTAATPKQTLAAVASLVPDIIKHFCVIHLTGVFTETGTVDFRRFVIGNGQYVIDGGSELTEVVVGTLTADDANTSTTSIGFAGAGWTVDAYMGYWVEVTSGVASGNIRTIQGNSATTITPQRNFSSDPGATPSFRIVRPSTEIASSVVVLLGVYNGTGIGAATGKSRGALQRIYFSGTTIPAVEGSQGAFDIAAVISNSSSTPAGIRLRSCTGVITLQSAIWDVATTYTTVSVTNGIAANPSQINSGTALSVQTCLAVNVQATCRGFLAANCGILFNAGSRCKGAAVMTDCVAGSQTTSTGFSNTSGYAVTTIDSASAVGLTLLRSTWNGTGMTVSSCGSHGIENDGGRLYLNGAVAGTGNGGAGVRNRRGGTVIIKNGTPPTITGSTGELLQGTTATSWSSLDTAGIVVQSTTDFCVAMDDNQ